MTKHPFKISIFPPLKKKGNVLHIEKVIMFISFPLTIKGLCLCVYALAGQQIDGLRIDPTLILNFCNSCINISKRNCVLLELYL